MKKIVILISILLLVGIGCTSLKKENKNPIPEKQKKVEGVEKSAPLKKLSDEKIQELDQTFKEKEIESGISLHYPTFIPEGLTLEKDSVEVFKSVIEENGILTYYIGAKPGSELPWILIQEQKDDFGIKERILQPNETALQNLNGFSTINTNNRGSFHNVIFTTDDNTFIRLTSRHFNISTLTKIAESIN